MLQKLITLCSFIITLNRAFELSDVEHTSKNVKSVAQNGKVVNSSVTEADDSWQPIIHTHNWLVAPTTLTPALSLFTVPASWQNLNLENNLTERAKEKHRKYTNPHTYHNHSYKLHHHSGNATQQHAKALMTVATLSTKSSTSPSRSQSTKHINMKSLVSPTYVKNNSREINDRYQFNSHHHQQLFHLNNKIATLYSHNQTPKDTKSQVQEHQKPSPLLHPAKNNKKQSKTSQQNLHNLAYRKEFNELTNPSAPLTHLQLLPPSQYQAHHIISLSAKNESIKTLNPKNLHVKTGGKNETDKDIDIIMNSTGTISTKSLNSFITNENLIDNEITTYIHEHQHQNHHDTSVTPIEIKYPQTDDKNNNKDADVEDAVTATDYVEDFSVELFLIETLENAQELYEYFKDIIMSEKGNNDANSSSNDNYNDENESDDEYSSEDTSNDNNNLQIQNSPSRQAVKKTFTTMAADIVTALEKLDSLSMENTLFSLASTGAAKGHERQIDESRKKYSLIQLATASLPLPLRVTNKTLNTTVKENFQSPPIKHIQTSGKLHNLFAKAKNVTAAPSSSSKTHRSSLLNNPKSEVIKAFISSRKVKKIKKKFKKFLVPLLLAYKLKFFTLIPVLISGLVLLVGTTGLAGFFFALFVTALSLGIGGANRIRRNYSLHRSL